MKKHGPPPQGKPRTWLITALLAALSVGYVVFIFLPLQRNIRAIKSELQEKRQHVMQAQSLNGAIARAHLQLASTREVALQWQEGAPQADELAQHFARVTQHAQATGVTISRFEPQPAVSMQTLSSHNVGVHFLAGFPQAFQFLSKLEQLPGTVWIRDVRLTRADGESGSTPTRENVAGELTLTIFVDRAIYSD
jgi:Tfp pilus assembly protein PilO